MPKNIEKVECISCGICCGHQRESFFGGCSYAENETVPDNITVVEKDGQYFIPVDENDVCIYLEVLDNGFTKCQIQNEKPLMCKLYYCLLEQKISSLKKAVEYIESRIKKRDSLSHLLKDLKV